MKYITLFLSLFIYSTVSGQGQTKRALFLGNSYTQVNDLPKMIADAAASTGDVLIYDSNVPGGYTLQGHSTNTTSLAKIAAGNWDYVVLQEQSQLPAFPINQVQFQVFPYAQTLNNLITTQNACAETVFYMTWGRKNGDAANCGFLSALCTYEGMDSLLSARYTMMANDNDAILSPVGAVWKHLRQHSPAINLYQADESHPSVAGTYAAACTFYAALFRKDPTEITFSSTLSASDAAAIRAAAKLIVYDNLLAWNIGSYDPLAGFTPVLSGANQVSFTNTSTNASEYFWSFGDGDTSTTAQPTHTYAAPGQYTVTLVASKCGQSDTLTQTVSISVNSTPAATDAGFALSVYPNPATKTLTLQHTIPGNLRYKIVNLYGAQVQTGTVNAMQQQLSVSSLADGLYFLQLLDGEKILGQQKFIKVSE